MKHIPKETTDDALVQEFLNKGGKISVGKTKPLPSELGLSNNTWNNKPVSYTHLTLPTN